MFDLQDDTKLAYEVKKYKCMYCRQTNNICFHFLGKCFLPKPNYLLCRLPYQTFKIEIKSLHPSKATTYNNYPPKYSAKAWKLLLILNNYFLIMLYQGMSFKKIWN